jgi:hypothetical protein
MIGIYLWRYKRDEFEVILVNSLLTVKVNWIIEELLSNEKTIVKIMWVFLNIINNIINIKYETWL